jgi:hypothetical protein
MFRINELPRNVLITPDEVIAMTAVDQNPGVNVILQSIQTAEERFIKPAICRDLYDYFRNEKNEEVTDVNKEVLEGAQYFNAPLELGQIVNAIELVEDEWLVTLWKEHLWKLTAEAVVYIATIPNWSRFGAAGEMINNPKTITEGSGAASADLAEVRFKLTKMQQDIIDPLIASTKEFLVKNAGRFPLFNCHRELCNEEDSKGISVSRKTGWIHVYEKRDRRKFNCDHDHY